MHVSVSVSKAGVTIVIFNTIFPIEKVFPSR